MTTKNIPTAWVNNSHFVRNFLENRMGNTGVWGNDPSICKRKKDEKKVASF